MSDAIFMAVALIVAAGIPDDDDSQVDENSANLLRKSVSDLFSVYNAFQALELLYTPVAIEFTEKTLKSIWNVAAGVPDPMEDTTSELLKLGPVTRHYTWVFDELEED